MKGTADKIVIIGGSAGSFTLITEILEKLPQQLDYALCVVIHRSITFNTKIESSLSKKLNRPVVSVTDKMEIRNGYVYFAPAGYHLLVEPDRTFALDSSEHVNYSKPSIDVFFETAAQVYRENCKAFLFSGANIDGAHGLSTVEHFGGKTFIQDPDEALINTMPLSGIQESTAATVLKNQEIIRYFCYNLFLP